jgi:hypothetical protein
MSSYEQELDEHYIDSYLYCAQNPSYLISPDGDIFDTKFDKIVYPRFNAERGCYQVNLRAPHTKSRQTTYTIATLVASVFCANDDPRANTVVHLDGDRANHEADNLVWRSRAFAIRYHKEILDVERWARPWKILDENHNMFDSIYDAALTFGIMPTDIDRSIRWDRKTNQGGIRFRSAIPLAGSLIGEERVFRPSERGLR